MKNIYRSLLLVIAGATQKELVRQIKYLKVENEILRRRLPARIRVAPRERARLVKFGAKLGTALRELVTIVHPDTLLRWIREERRTGRRTRAAKLGRRRTPDQIRKLIVKLAKETDWGYSRILGELKKLNVVGISRNTVKNILKEHGLDPRSQAGRGNLGRLPETARRQSVAMRLLP